MMNNSGKKDESLRGNKNKIYCMLLLHQIKLMTSNGFCILLILLDKKIEGGGGNGAKPEKGFMYHQ